MNAVVSGATHENLPPQQISAVGQAGPNIGPSCRGGPTVSPQTVDALVWTGAGIDLFCRTGHQKQLAVDDQLVVELEHEPTVRR